MTSLPTHGQIACRACFSSPGAHQELGEWRITNDPGAWGSDNPKYLVLGFSKGFTQANAYQHGPFEQVAFAQFRPRLQAVLVRLGLLDTADDIDSLMTARETDWAFGSVVRCSLCRRDPKTGKWAATGPLIKKSFVEEPARTYLAECTQRFLGDLPKRIRFGILLGNDDGYVAGLKSVFRGLHADSYSDINPMAFRARDVVWINVAHPSGSNGHLQSWLDAQPGTKQGAKALHAIEAVERYRH